MTEDLLSLSDPQDRGGKPPPSLTKSAKASARAALMPSTLRDVLPPAVTVLVLLVAWQLVVVVFHFQRFILPTPGDVASALTGQFGYLLSNAVTTLEELGLGFGLSVCIGVALGIAIANSKLFANATYPLIVGTQAIPKLALAPLFAVWFGLGLLPKVLISFLIAFYPVTINAVVGFGPVAAATSPLAQSLGLRGLRRFWKIDVPGSLPSLFAGLKVAISFATIGAVVGEFVGGDSGLGYVTLNASTQLNTSLLFATLVMLTVIGLLGYCGVAIVEKLLVPWSKSK